MPNQGIGVRIVGGADGNAMQAMQAVVSSKAPPEDNQVLTYSPCSDSLTMSEFLHHSAKWHYIYPSFGHISDLIKKELIDPNYYVYKYQGFYQIAVGSVFFLIPIIFFFIAGFSKLWMDSFDELHPYDHIANFFNPFQSIGGFLLTVGLAGFALHIVFRNRKNADQSFKDSKDLYKNYRKQLIVPHKTLMTFFALCELIHYLRHSDFNEIVKFSPSIVTKRDEFVKKLNKLHRRSGRIFSQDRLLYTNGLENDQEQIKQNFFNLLTDCSENKITLGKFGAIWGLLIPEIEALHSDSEYKNNLKPDHDRVHFVPNFEYNLNNDQQTQQKIIEIIGIIASQKINQRTSGLFMAMNLRQRFMPIHLQKALDSHRGHPNVFPNISDPSIVKHDALALKILVIMTNVHSGYRNCMISDYPLFPPLPNLGSDAVLPVMPCSGPVNYQPISNLTAAGADNSCAGPVVTYTPWARITPSDRYLPPPPEDFSMHVQTEPTEIVTNPGPLQQPIVPIFNRHITHNHSLPQLPLLKANPSRGLPGPPPLVPILNAYPATPGGSKLRQEPTLFNEVPQLDALQRYQ